MTADHTELRELLKSRLEVIADHAFRDRDAAGHLELLKSVSEKIDRYHKAHASDFDAKMRHYLTNSSYQKALEHLG